MYFSPESHWEMNYPVSLYNSALKIWNVVLLNAAAHLDSS